MDYLLYDTSIGVIWSVGATFFRSIRFFRNGLVQKADEMKILKQTFKVFAFKNDNEADAT